MTVINTNVSALRAQNNSRVASQMQSAELERTTVDIGAQVTGRQIDMRATGQVIKFDPSWAYYDRAVRT